MNWNSAIKQLLAFIVINFAAILWLFNVSTFANDSTAVLAAGGLKLEKSVELAILSEKLRIGSSRIVVDYEIKNISPHAVETIIAFPLPILEGPMLVNLPVDVDPKSPENFINFKTSVDNKEIVANKEQKAFLIEENGQLGREVTSEILAAGIFMSPLDNKFYDRLASLTAEQQQKLIDAKLLLIEEHGKEHTFTPLWAVEYSYYSRHKFLPDKIVHIHHEYTPVSGRSLFGEFSFTDDLKKWCVDDTTKKALHKLIETQPVTSQWAKIIEMRQVDYILKTGANWAGPIRSFELTIEKKNPKQIVSVCAEELKRISKTEFRLTRQDFTPTEDLSIVFFEPIVQGKK